MQLRFRILSVIAPNLAAKKALNIFQKPHFNKVRDREKEFLNNAKILKLDYKNEDILIYESGDENGKPVITVHGWDSNPGSLSGITNELVQNGFHVFSLNVPAHGISTLKGTNMFETAEIIIHILKYINQEGEVSFVTHSFGSGAVSLALQISKIKSNKLAFVTSPDKLWDIFKDFSNMIGLNNRAFNSMIKITEKRFKRSFDEMQISKVLSKANFNKLLIVHDKNDTILPYSNAIKINEMNPNSEIFSTEGRGHYRILWDKPVIKTISDFLLS